MTRVELGDWQTPDALAEHIVQNQKLAIGDVRAVLEPTCGDGSFLAAAAASFPHAKLFGFDLSPARVALAKSRLPRSASIEVADFFQVDWKAQLAALPQPLLIVGNPPWVTSAAVGALGTQGKNLPAKMNRDRLSGLDALTGKSNFDISEWMIDALLTAAEGRAFHLAMLCKASVARRVVATCARLPRSVSGAVRALDARKFFAAAVDAVLLTVGTSEPRAALWPVYASLDATEPVRRMALIDDQLVGDAHAFAATRNLAGSSAWTWRSGIKHDCAPVMELDRAKRAVLQIEDELVYPLLKGGDLASGRPPAHSVIVTQLKLGDDTRTIAERAPKTWAYLLANQARLAARKSRIYVGQPPFAMFGIGGYTFARYKVAISGLHKRLTFRMLEPVDDRPVMLDDTCYFIACQSRDEAARLTAALNGPSAKAFFEARVFWDAKRPINKALLSALSIDALLALGSD